ncbi:MAG: alcohol dehydrogenase catalytic domain-containing protein [Clostridiales Family XIII bacterium]|jgi:L-iditol 2-dehydrogenase|nr:alcohol dehydrogenase catalytic domain-containing protein [Clostridiales Family XIII bacterium]
MKAAVYLGKDEIEIQDVPDPVAGDGDIVVKIHACAVCGSDIRIFHHGNPRVHPPQIIGHESAGEVVAIGKGVTKFAVGDHVAIGADVPCGACEFCEAGIGNNCQINYALGYQFPGSFAQYVLLNKLTVDLGPVHAINPAMAWDEAALAEPLACVLNATELADIKLGDTVVIIGAGPIGLMIMPIVRMLGAIKVIVVQRSEKRLEMAKLLGADVTIASSKEDAIARVKEETRGLGADVIFTANSSPETHRDAMQMAKNRARISLFGGLAAGSKIELETNIIHYKELIMMGAHGAMPRHHRKAIDLIAARRPDMRPYISDHFALDDIKKAFELTESHQAMRVVVNPWQVGE